MRKYLLLLLLTSLSVEAQIVNIPDANFKAKLLEASPSNQIALNLQNQYFKIDLNNDGEIQVSEALNVSSLDIRNSNISSIEGILEFINIENINCDNNQITELYISNLENLESISIKYNALNTLVAENLFSLFSFDCSNNNQLNTLTLSNISEVHELYCTNSSLVNLSLSNVKGYTFLFNDNQITNLILQNIDYHQLDLRNNQILDFTLSDTNLGLQALDLLLNNNPLQNLTIVNCDLNSMGFGNFIKANNTSLNTVSLINSYVFDLQLEANQISVLQILNSGFIKLRLDNNLLTEVDMSSYNPISNSIEYNLLSLYNNPLHFLNLKNGENELYVDLQEVNGLSYLCVDEDEIEFYNEYLAEILIENVEVNSYCSFVPGGEFFTIQGNSTLDLSGNGCDENDLDFPNMKFNITNSNISGNIISDVNGDYSIPVQEGTHTITPVLENPAYFNASPANFTVTFPTEASPFTQNFCLTPNGTHQDVEVIIIPTGAAIPGFDSSYSIIYKNKGNTVVSGSLSLTFTDNVMDFVSSTPVQSMVEPNILNWNYTNLQPFETREIQVVFNLNSPQENPALNGGEILEFIAIIDPLSGDEIPSDNVSILNQEVVNSYDPNDKTCLEGSVVSSELIGQYVHYVIRFENTGTYFAQNVVVKDEIDLAKFDISTLIPLHASHAYFARINGNKVEFIFENIQLPFPPSEERHGYIAFKIKLKNNLIAGDTFSNFASIYFDYNFPIITEPVTTSIEALSNPDFEFSSFVKLYPNPVNSILTIESQSGINLKSVEIFNSLGQLIKAVPNGSNLLNIDVSNVQTGMYFAKVYSDRGAGISTFVKL